MNDSKDTMDQANEDILACKVSDEALKIAAGAERSAASAPFTYVAGPCC